ncbi:MAG: energy transducer TonB [Candidatus Binatia bacterium]
MEPHSPLEREAERDSLPHQGKGEGGLWRWVCFSGLLHGVIVWSLFLIPHTTFRRAISYPVYTVELVTGERIGGALPDSETKPAREIRKKPSKKPKKVKKKESTPKLTAPKKISKVKKVKPPPRIALVKKKKKKKDREKKSKRAPRTVKRVKKSMKQVNKNKEEQTKTGLSDHARQKLIQAALERVKQRAGAAQKKKSYARKTSRGGGIVKGVEFLIYRNRMLRLIKERWTWVGKRTDLEVTVRFGIVENGEIVGLRIVDVSGDPSYDNSVIRAVRRTSPLPPPPVSYRKDFMNVELTFRPEDLSG